MRKLLISLRMSLLMSLLMSLVMIGGVWGQPRTGRLTFEDAGGVDAWPWKVIHNCTQTLNADGTITLVCGDITSIGNCLTGACPGTTMTWGDGIGPVVHTYSVTGVDPVVTATDGKLTLTGTFVSDNVGVGTVAPDTPLEINAPAGGALRLTYNDANGTAATHADLSVGATGSLTIAATGTNPDIILTPGGSGAVKGIIEQIGGVFDGGGAAIPLNKIVYRRATYAATINEWMVICNTAESTMVVDVLRLTRTVGVLPTASMVGAGNKPTSTNYETWAAPSGWTSTAIAVDDVVAFKVTTGAATATWCSVDLKVTR